MTTRDGIGSIEERVRECREKLCSGTLGAEGLTQVEEGIRADLDAIGREAMRQVFEAAAVDAPEVWINGVLHGRVRRFNDKVHTTFGEVPVDKTSYRKDGKSPPVVAMEKALGLVEGSYTPKAAKIMCLLTALAVRDDVEKIVGEFGGMSMGSATLYRIPQVVMARYELRRPDLEQQVRERSPIPPEAVSVQFGLDGVMVPQDGEHCDPRGRTPRNDPDPPRHERTVGTMPPSPRDADGKEGISWHEASVATVSYHDQKGKHLHTTYLGRMPEAYKATLEQMLTEEARLVAACRPDLRPVFASDGAEGQWATLQRIRATLPVPMQDVAINLLDLFHMGEHLQQAADAIHGNGTAKARVARVEWLETLRAYDDGLERVRQCLRRFHRQATSQRTRDAIDRVLTYLKSNKDRVRYKFAEEHNLPLATGPTEAAAKSLVGVRMKRSGARYSQHGGQTILTLLAAHKSGRFDVLWDVIVTNCYAANVSVPRVA